MEENSSITEKIANVECSTITLALNDFIETVGGKWRFPIIFNLYFSQLRFSELKRKLPGITPRALTQNISELEHNLLITRGSAGYQLTEYALTLKDIIDTLWEIYGKECDHDSLPDERLKLLSESVQSMFTLLGGKWRMPILGYLLFNEECRFSEMRAGIARISSKELTKNISALCESGMIIRKGESNRFLHSLSPDGKALEPLIRKIVLWTLIHREKIKQLIHEGERSNTVPNSPPFH